MIKKIEKVMLGVIAVLTLIATVQEIITIYSVGSVTLPDLLLLFIYTEVLGMIGVFYTSNKIPITLPLFIAMTALSRLIILQSWLPLIIFPLGCLIAYPPINQTALCTVLCTQSTVVLWHYPVLLF